jgi:hypothetical protein
VATPNETKGSSRFKRHFGRVEKFFVVLICGVHVNKNISCKLGVYMLCVVRS